MRSCPKGHGQSRELQPPKPHWDPNLVSGAVSTSGRETQRPWAPTEKTDYGTKGASHVIPASGNSQRSCHPTDSESHSETAIHRGVAHCESAVLPESLWPAMPLHIFSRPHTHTLSHLSGQPLPPSPPSHYPSVRPSGLPPVPHLPVRPSVRPRARSCVPARGHPLSAHPPILQVFTASVSISLCWREAGGGRLDATGGKSKSPATSPSLSAQPGVPDVVPTACPSRLG